MRTNAPSSSGTIHRKAPERFTVKFLESLDFKSTADRLIIGVLKSLSLLDDQGRPTQRYFTFLDQTQSAAVLAEAVRESYSDLFAVNVNAQTLNKTELINKFKTLSQGSLSESVLEKLAMTFQALVKLADFSAPVARHAQEEQTDPEDAEGELEFDADQVDAGVSKRRRNPRGGLTATANLGGLHYNIQIILPESRDPQVWPAESPRGWRPDF